MTTSCDQGHNEKYSSTPASQESTPSMLHFPWAVFLKRARPQAVRAHHHLHASPPGLGLQGKTAEELRVNLGVDFAGAKLCSGMMIAKFSSQCPPQSMVMQEGAHELFLGVVRPGKLSSPLCMSVSPFLSWTITSEIYSMGIFWSTTSMPSARQRNSHRHRGRARSPT